MSRRSDFWSRRKAGVEAEARALQEDARAAETVERSYEEVLEELNLVAPEELETSEAIKDFLNHDLPQRLKTRALRQLWKSDPVFANLDGLVDYGEDFTDAATVMDKMETVYQVGKGMMTAFLAEDETKGETGAVPELEQDAAPDRPDDILQTNEAPEPVMAVIEEAPDPVEQGSDAVAIAAPPRRMRFVFETA